MNTALVSADNTHRLSTAHGVRYPFLFSFIKCILCASNKNHISFSFFSFPNFTQSFLFNLRASLSNMPVTLAPNPAVAAQALARATSDLRFIGASSFMNKSKALVQTEQRQILVVGQARIVLLEK